MLIGDTVKRLRKEKKLTQDQFAKLLGVSPSTIKSIEGKKNNPSLSLLNKMAIVLDCDKSVLLDEKLKEDIPIKYDMDFFVIELMKRLVKEGMIEDINNIKEEEYNLLMAAIKMDLKRIKKDI